MGRVDNSLLSRACDVPTSANPESSLNDLFSNPGSSKQKEEDYVFWVCIDFTLPNICSPVEKMCYFLQYTLFKTVIGLLEASSWTPHPQPAHPALHFSSVWSCPASTGRHSSHPPEALMCRRFAAGAWHTDERNWRAEQQKIFGKSNNYKNSFWLNNVQDWESD